VVGEAANGRGALDRLHARRLMGSLRPAGETAAGAFDELSERELEILRLIAESHANKEIAPRLVISERTARTHVSNILRKLGLSSRRLSTREQAGRRHQRGNEPLCPLFDAIDTDGRQRGVAVSVDVEVAD
jgi:DNA-binding NarL/FixJ family response regulator